VSAQQFLAANRLADNFHLPLSLEALEETRSLQANVTHVIMETCINDKWTYVWGSEAYSSFIKSFLPVLLQRATAPHLIFMVMEDKMHPQDEIFLLVGSLK
jgi:hypothetical protein